MEDTDGHQNSGAMAWRRSDQVKQDFLNTRQIQKILKIPFSNLGLCHHTLTSKIY